MPTNISVYLVPRQPTNIQPLSWFHRVPNLKNPRKRFAKWEAWQQTQNTILTFSLYCKDNGEKVYEAECAPVIEKKLKDMFAYTPIIHGLEYGDVVNRFRTKIHSTVMYAR